MERRVKDLPFFLVILRVKLKISGVFWLFLKIFEKSTKKVLTFDF